MLGRTINSICSSPSIILPDVSRVIEKTTPSTLSPLPSAVPPSPPPVSPDLIPPAPLFLETIHDDDDAVDDVEYVSLNAIDFTDTSFAWSNPSTSTDVHHLPDPDPATSPFDSMVEATLHQLNIATNPTDEEPVCVEVPIH